MILADFQICISAPLKEDGHIIVMYGFQIATTKDEIFRAIFKTLTRFKSVKTRENFYTHWKHQTTSGFLMLLGGIDNLCTDICKISSSFLIFYFKLFRLIPVTLFIKRFPTQVNFYWEDIGFTQFWFTFIMKRGHCF